MVEEQFSYKGHSLIVPDYRILECLACGEAIVEKGVDASGGEDTEVLRKTGECPQFPQS